MRGVSRQLSQDRCSRILFVIGTERWGTRASWGLLHNKEDEGPAGADGRSTALPLCKTEGSLPASRQSWGANATPGGSMHRFLVSHSIATRGLGTQALNATAPDLF